MKTHHISINLKLSGLFPHGYILTAEATATTHAIQWKKRGKENIGAYVRKSKYL